MAYDLKNVRVLIVDDMKPMLKLTHSVLSAMGFVSLFQAQSAKEGFEKLCKFDPEIVLTDWIMEPEDGLSFARHIRSSPMSPNPYVPIIMMTGFSSQLRVEMARDSGITEFLVKPFAARDLYERIVQIVERPRQFVDSGNFFGPDRRRKSDSDYHGPRRRATDEDAKEPELSEEQKARSANILNELRENVSEV